MNVLLLQTLVSVEFAGVKLAQLGATNFLKSLLVYID